MDNFSEALQRVKTSLEEKSACFCAFDLEFTGLSIQGGGSDTDLDSIQDRYARARETAQNFLPLQFGLSIFHLRDGAYEAETFTFHLFPKPCKAARYDRRFTCQVHILHLQPCASWMERRWHRLDGQLIRAAPA